MTTTGEAEPLVRGNAFFGLRAAVQELWGAPGLRAVEHRVSDEVRAAVAERIITPHVWLPERYLTRFCEAIWDRPAARDEAAFRRCVERSVYHGWGRFQRLLLQLVSASALASRAPALWKRDHTHGTLDLALGDGECTIWLADSAYGATEFSRLLIAETFRSIVAMTRVPAGAPVRESHKPDHARRVVIQLSWSDSPSDSDSGS